MFTIAACDRGSPFELDCTLFQQADSRNDEAWPLVICLVCCDGSAEFAGEASIFSTSQGTQRKVNSVDESVRGSPPSYADDLYGKDWKGLER